MFASSQIESRFKAYLEALIDLFVDFLAVGLGDALEHSDALLHLALGRQPTDGLVDETETQEEETDEKYRSGYSQKGDLRT